MAKKVQKRYSDVELEKFKKIILKKLKRALEDLAVLSGSTRNEHGTDGTARSFETVEKASQMAANDENLMFMDRLKKLIRDLELALLRIGCKTYGICRKTGKLIPKDRLCCVPHATLSIEAKRQQ